MKIKTSELKDKALDYVVAKIESGIEPEYFNGSVWITTGGFFARVRRNVFEPSTKWSQGGPIIERELIRVISPTAKGINWVARIRCGMTGTVHEWLESYGPTPLIAAMRVFVASKLRDEVEIPEELV